jgi:hypothetical protein
MSDMTRYILTDDGNTEIDDEGYLVYYTSAVAAVAAARAEERQRINSMPVVDYVREQYERGAADKAAELQDYYGEQAHGHYMDGLERGQRDERGRIRKGVAAFLASELATSSDGAVYYMELDDEDPSCGHDVTFRMDKLYDIINGHDR